MKKRNLIIIILAVVIVLAVAISGAVWFFGSGFIGGGSNNDSDSSSLASDSSETESKSETKLDEANQSGNSASSNGSQSSTGSQSTTQNGNTTTFSVGNITAKSGEKIKVPVKVSSNQGFMGVAGQLNYDTSVLKYTGYKQGKLLKDYQLAEENGKIKFMSVEDNDMTKNGVVFYLEFEVIAQSSSTSEITLDINSKSIANKSEQYVPVKTENGSVIIK